MTLSQSLDDQADPRIFGHNISTQCVSIASSIDTTPSEMIRFLPPIGCTPRRNALRVAVPVSEYGPGWTNDFMLELTLRDGRPTDDTELACGPASEGLPTNGE